MVQTKEQERLNGDGDNWKRWGPYLSERAWGTVREDYSEDGNAWMYFPYDQARSRTYRWNEDGLVGFPTLLFTDNETNVQCFNKLLLTRYQHPIDTPAIHIDNFQRDISNRHQVPQRWIMSQVGKDEFSQGCIVPRLFAAGSGDPNTLPDAIVSDHSVDQPTSIDSLGEGLFIPGLILALDLADKFLHQVL